MSGEIRFIRKARQPSAWLARSIDGIGIKVKRARCLRERRGIVRRPMTDFFLSHLSCVQLFATPWAAACQTSLSITNSRSLLKLMSIKSLMPSNHLTLCRPLLLPPSIFPTSGSFQMSQFFASGGQSIGVSVSESSFQ